MRYINQLLSQQERPLIKNFWLRFIKYFIGATIISYGLYSVLSQMDLDALRLFNNKRSAMALLMLNIMSAKNWGWFFFVAIISSALWGDWRNFRWQSFPKEKLKGQGGDESNSNNGN